MDDLTIQSSCENTFIISIPCCLFTQSFFAIPGNIKMISRFNLLVIDFSFAIRFYWKKMLEINNPKRTSQSSFKEEEFFWA